MNLRSFEIARLKNLIAFLCVISLSARAQDKSTPPRREMHPIVIGADDKPAFPLPPKDFDVRRENIPHGKTDTVWYNSKTVGTRRKMLIYTPPYYSAGQKYPVLYLLHGIGGDETEWYRYGCQPDVILDNLIADKKMVPMIVIFPNGRAQVNDRAEGDVFRHVKAFEIFEKDLLNDIIPFVEGNYSVTQSPDARAIAGFSMGGGQALNFGMGNLEVFAWVAGFSSAPNTRTPQQLASDPMEAVKKIKLLYLSCGDQDALISISQGIHAYLKEKSIPHVWHIESGGHNIEFWKNDLYHVSQLLFKK